MMSTRAESLLTDLVMTVRYYADHVHEDLELEELHEVAERMLGALVAVRRQQVDRAEQLV